MQEVVGRQHAQYNATLSALGSIYIAQQRTAEAEPLLRELAEWRRANLGPTHPELANTRFTLGVIYHGQQRTAEAEAAYREAVDIARQQQPLDELSLGDFLHNLGVLLYNTGRIAEAEPAAREALMRRSAVLAAGHFKPAQSRSILGGILVELEQYEEAETLLLAAYDVLKENPPVPPNFLPDCIERLVKLYEAWERPPQAARWRDVLAEWRASTQPAVASPSGTR